MDFTLPNGHLRCIAPLADMFNHDPDSPNQHLFELISGRVIIKAGKNHSIGDQVYIYSVHKLINKLISPKLKQVFINYGRIPNNRLLRLYGFILPSNPHDSYDLVLSTNEHAPLYREKNNIFSKAGLDVVSTFPLTLSEPLHTDVLRYIRIQRATENELSLLYSQSGTMVARNRLNARNESEILHALIEAFERILNNFVPTMNELKTRLDSGIYPAGGKTWCAAHVSIGEQKILTEARDRAKSLLLSFCASCGKDANKICGGCEKVAYCNAYCQKVNRVHHKSVCAHKKMVL